VTSSGPEAVELAALAGLHLDPWQQHVMQVALGEQADGKWSAFRVGLVIPRQNGKTATLVARMLASLFLLDDDLTVFSAHQFSTARRTFLDLVQTVRDCPPLWRRVGDRGLSMGSGREGIRTTDGREVTFVARSKNSARGYSASCVILDEAYDLAEETMNAMLPTLTAQPNPQVWFASSPVNQSEHFNGLALTRVRETAMKGEDARLAYFEWSVDEDVYENAPDDVSRDPAQWAVANPALGRRIAPSFLSDELHALSPVGFAVEHLGVGDWPSTDPSAGRLIPEHLWDSLVDAESQIDGPVAFGVDASRDRRWATIVAAGFRSDGRVHVEVVEHRKGLDWLPERLLELAARHDPTAIVLDAKSQAATVVPDMTSAGLEITVGNYATLIGSCGKFHDLVGTDRLRHRNHPALTKAVGDARQRNASGAWVYDRPISGDGSALIAAALAVGEVAAPDMSPSPEQAMAQVF